MNAVPATVDEYIASFPPEVQAVLRAVRATIHRAAPLAEERISYRMPALFQGGVVVYFGAFKNHLGLFPPVEDPALRDRVALYAGPKGNLQFPYGPPIPHELIAAVVRARLQSNLARLEAKRPGLSSASQAERRTGARPSVPSAGRAGDTMPVGYSATPLPRKLGITASTRLAVLGGPSEYASILGELPVGAQVDSRLGAGTSIVHLFVTQREALASELSRLREALRPDAVVWVSWPKKASKVPTTVTEDVIRELALPMGFVDVKVCAVTEVWSGLKLVVRKELRT